jgi:hypothetical protein
MLMKLENACFGRQFKKKLRFRQLTEIKSKRYEACLDILSQRKHAWTFGITSSLILER